MKEFLVGLIFLLAAFLLAGLGIMLIPLWMIFAVALRVALIIIFIICAIWLLGKFIIFIWEKIRGDIS